jgi:hypothetical protein
MNVIKKIYMPNLKIVGRDSLIASNTNYYIVDTLMTSLSIASNANLMENYR